MSKIDEILKRKPFVVPNKCPDCGSKNIMGYAQVVTHAYIKLTDMSIDEVDSNDDVELEDNDPRYWDYVCNDCENIWDDYNQGRDEKLKARGGN